MQQKKGGTFARQCNQIETLDHLEIEKKTYIYHKFAGNGLMIAYRKRWVASI